MKRTSLAAMLTLLAVLAATLAVAGCGGKTTSSSTSTQTSGTTSTRARLRTSTPQNRLTRAFIAHPDCAPEGSAAAYVLTLAGFELPSTLPVASSACTAA